MLQQSSLFLLFQENICYGYLLEAPWRGASYEYHNIYSVEMLLMNTHSIRASTTTKPTIRLERAAKTQISLHFRAVYSRDLADCMCLLQPLGYSERNKQEPSPYWVDIKADLSLCCRKGLIVGFVVRWLISFHIHCVKLASVAQLDAPSNWRPGGCGVNPCRGRQHSFMEIDQEIFSTVILSLSLIQEGSCQFLAKECAQYWLTA